MLSLDLQRILKIKEYCDDISNALTRYGISFEAFQEDTLYQYSVFFCILQIGELSGGLSAEFRQATNDRIPWSAIKSMRNIVAHGYGGIRLDIVWQTVLNDIPILKQFCEEELAKCQE